MTAHNISTQWSDAISFNRLHALAKRGYKAKFGSDSATSDFSYVDLFHPRLHGTCQPPIITLWSNGIVSTNEILWPEKYVAQENGPPDWQKFIDVADSNRFDEFLKSIPLPNWLDLYILPFYRQCRIVTIMVLLGFGLCLSLAGVLWLIKAAARLIV